MCLGALHQMGETPQMLAAISIATLDQLGDVLDDDRTPSTGDLAAALLDRAVQFDLASPSAVHAAASRLDVIARRDHWQLHGRGAPLASRRTPMPPSSTARSRCWLPSSNRPLERRGLPPELMAERLCLAASSPQPT